MRRRGPDRVEADGAQDGAGPLFRAGGAAGGRLRAKRGPLPADSLGPRHRVGSNAPSRRNDRPQSIPCAWRRRVVGGPGEPQSTAPTIANGPDIRELRRRQRAGRTRTRARRTAKWSHRSGHVRNWRPRWAAVRKDEA
jgi:hypothetical protein